MGYKKRQWGEKEVRKSKKKQMKSFCSESFHVISIADPIRHAILISSQPARLFYTKINREINNACTLSACLGFQSHCQRLLIWKGFDLFLDEISLDKENFPQTTPDASSKWIRICLFPNLKMARVKIWQINITKYSVLKFPATTRTLCGLWGAPLKRSLNAHQVDAAAFILILGKQCHPREVICV